MNRPGPNRAEAQKWFAWACIFELLLGALALLIGTVLGLFPLSSVIWNSQDAVLGLAASLPLFGFFLLMLNSSWPWLKEISDFLEHTVRPIFIHWSAGQLAAVSLLAGVGEELLFRGVAQEALTRAVGLPLALVIASVLFGLCHAVTGGYAVIASLMGIYLGLLWAYSGNLLVPIVTHAIYDFLALMYFLRKRAP